MTDEATDAVQTEKTTGWRSRLPKLALLAAAAGGTFLYVRDPERWKSRLSRVRRRTTGTARGLSRRIIPADDAETRSNPGSAPHTGAPMHARVGFYRVKPGTLDASLEKARNELLPRMREQPGLKRYTVITTGPDSFISLSGWEARHQAEQAAETLSAWVTENMGPTVVSSESHIGEVALMHGQTAPDRTPKYGMVHVLTPKPGAPDLTEKLRSEFMPIYDRQPGFNTFTMAKMDDGRRVAFAGWGTEAAFERAQPTLNPWGEANIRPHMADVQVHQGQVAWSVRKA